MGFGAGTVQPVIRADSCQATTSLGRMAEQVKVTLYNDAGCPWGSYQRDRAEARSAAGSPTQLQDKHAKTDGPVRYTAPSLVFERAGMRFTRAAGRR